MNETTAKEVRRYIGARIKHARALNRQSQADLANRLHEHTGQDWTREIVANLETGRRAIPVELMCSIAAVQERTVGWYFADAPGTLRDAIPGLFGTPSRALQIA